jgi:hypothetical protein
MTTPDRHLIRTHENGRWRARFHRVGTIALATLAASVALHWAWTNIQARSAVLPEPRYVDSLAVLVALTMLTFTLGLAWRASGNAEDRA